MAGNTIQTIASATLIKIEKVYDVSAVSIPANQDTEISARSYFNGVIEQDKAEEIDHGDDDREERQRMALRLMLAK